MTLNQMKYFNTLAECLSFTEAAKCLFITQPALSRQILAMEEELGTKLLVRDKKKLKLTPGGSLLYNRFSEILSEYADAVEEAKTANLGYEGKLRIGFLDIYDISEIFSGVLSEFQSKNPKVQLTMERASLGELPQLLYEDTLDLILTYGFSLYDQPQLVTVNIQKFHSCMMLHAAHPLARKADISLKDLEGESFVQLAPDICEEGHRYILSLLEKSGLHPDIRTVHKMEDVMLWVQTGNAVAITTNRTVERQNPHVILRKIPMEEAAGHDITMAWHKGNFNPAIAMFMELLEERLAKNERIS